MSKIIEIYTYRNGLELEIRQGDITEERVDAIVNAANSALKHGGGVAGAIVRKGGSQIQLESDRWIKTNGPVTHTKPAVTGAGHLPCKYILHAVGPVWGEGNEDKKLEQAILGCLSLAQELKLTSIAFPAISTGIFGFPKERAAKIFFSKFHEFFENLASETNLNVRLVIFDMSTLDAFLRIFTQYFNQI